MTDEEFYDAEVAPVLLDLGAKCEARGITLLAVAECPEAEVRGSTVTIGSGASYYMWVLLTLAQSGAANGGVNFDAFLLAVLRDLLDSGRPHSSMLLAQLGCAPAPASRPGFDRGGPP